MPERTEIQEKFDGVHRQGREQTAQILEVKDLGIWRVGAPDRVSKKYSNLMVFVAGSFLLASFFEISGSIGQGLQTSKQILGTATSGFEFLESGDFDLANQNFEQAREEMRRSEETLIRIVDFLPLGRDFDRALESGSRITKAIGFLVEGVAQFQSARLEWDIATNSSNSDFFEALKMSRENLIRSSQELTAAVDLLREINVALLPESEKIRFTEAKTKLEAARVAIDELANIQSILIDLLGGDRKTYALIFQNNNEARAAGGFIGTYGLLEFANGRMRIDRIESIYTLDGQLEERIAAPWPLQRQLTAHWGARDSNWFMDFPASAREFLDLLEKAIGVDADGVISMTPDVFEKLLELTGPIEMPAYGEVLTAENFRDTVQFKTSVDYDRVENRPKKFLADFAPIFLSKIRGLEQQGWLDFVNLVFQMIAEKQLLVFSENPKMQSMVESYRADGAIAKTDGDYLAIFHSNVGGGKTDLGIGQKVEKRVSIDSSGLAIVRLRITRTHNAFNELFFPKNLDFMRIAVPQSAELLSASGFDQFVFEKTNPGNVSIDPEVRGWEEALRWDERRAMYIGEEAGHKIFANWQVLEPGQSKSVELVYEIQFDSPAAYTQLLQKQPGAAPFDFTLDINYLAGEIVYYHPPQFTHNGNTLTIAESVNTDRFYGLIGR